MAWLLVLCFFGLGLSFLVVREVLLPRAHEYRSQIATALEHAIGLPVEIDSLSADWSGFRPRFHLSGLSIIDQDGDAALRLGKVDATLAWSSLARGRMYFDRLVVFSPQLSLRRDREGHLFVAGVRIDPHGGGRGFPDWLLLQREILILDAGVTWADDLRGAERLDLTDVNIRLSRHGARYRFGIRSNPPASVASMLDVRGDLIGARPGDPGTWVGQVYVGLDDADLGAWRQWVDDPLPLEGFGSVRAWIDVEAGLPRNVTADLALDAVETRLGEMLPEMQLDGVRGRFSGRRVGTGYEFAVRSMAIQVGPEVRLDGMDIDLSLREIGDIVRAGGRFQANHLDLAVLARLADHLPLGEGFRERLADFGPKGTLEGLDFEWGPGEDGVPFWSVRSRFSDLGIDPTGLVPGLSGWSGEVSGDRAHGRFRVGGLGASVDLPAVFPESLLTFETIQAEGGWTHRGGRPEIVLDGVRFENADAAGSASGRYFPVEGGRGEIDLAGRLTRAEATAVWRYLPWVVNEYTRNWLRESLRSGAVPEARLRLKGDLDDFPFDEGRSGQFLVTTRVNEGVLDYAEGWPRITGIDAELRFEGPGMHISADRARILGATLGAVVADVPDLGARGGPIMTIRGGASGPTAEFLRFVSSSPVTGRIDGFTDHIVAEGRGSLELELVMPLGDIDATRVSGEYRFAGNRISVLEGLPPLTDAAGRVRFTRDRLSITDATARAFGEPLRLTASTPDGGGVRFSVEGGAAMRAVRETYGWPILAHLSGRMAWGANIDVQPRGVSVTVTSPLTGVSSSLPYPFNKQAAAAWPLEFVVKLPRSGRGETLRARVHDIVRVDLEGRRDGNGWVTDRGGIGIRAPLQSAQRGVLLTANLAELDLDAWRRVLDPGGGDAGEAEGLAGQLAGVDLRARQVRVQGRTLSEVEFGAVADDGGWRGRIASEQASGTFDWRSAGKGALHARFEHLSIGANEDADTRSQDAAGDEVLKRLPGLDIVVERFVLREMELGSLALAAINEEGLWTLQSLRIENPDGQLVGSGGWRSGAAPRTDLKFQLETGNVGRLLDRLGYSETVRGGSAQLSGRVEWQGSPVRIDHPSLGGAMTLEARKGQFRKLEPGVGRLLGVLSLQSLPRRLALDFRDVFSEGFAFESISGSIEMASGVLRTEDLSIAGPAARIWITGTANVEQETQDLLVLVQPTLSESVAIGAAAGLINPVAGVIAYLAQKALSDPIERMFAFGYAITGTWADPVVEKLPGGPSADQAETRGEQ